MTACRPIGVEGAEARVPGGLPRRDVGVGVRPFDAAMPRQGRLGADDLADARADSRHAAHGEDT
jgi:hypothetical protein